MHKVTLECQPQNPLMAFFHPGWTLIQINLARSCKKDHNLITFWLIHTEKPYNQSWQQGWRFAGEEKGSERRFCGPRFLGTYFTICGSLLALCKLRWHGGTVVNIPVFVLQVHNGCDCCIKDKRQATCVCSPSPLHVKGVSCGRGRVYVTGFMCVSVGHTAHSAEWPTVLDSESVVASDRGRGGPVWVSPWVRTKSRAGKNGFGKRNKQKIYLWLNKHVRGGMFSRPDQQFLLGPLTLTPTFTCSQVDSLHLEVRGCTCPVHHMQIILHWKAARLSRHGEDRMPFVTRFLRQTTTTTYRVK